MISFIITGNPISSKNAIRSGITKNGRNYTYTLKAVKDYRDSALKQLMLQDDKHAKDNNMLPQNYSPWRTAPCNIAFHFYVKDNRNYDLCNLMQCPLDLLKQSHIIADDNYKIVPSLDGSRVMGIDKDNPRTIINITII